MCLHFKKFFQCSWTLEFQSMHKRWIKNYLSFLSKLSSLWTGGLITMDLNHVCAHMLTTSHCTYTVDGSWLNMASSTNCVEILVPNPIFFWRQFYSLGWLQWVKQAALTSVHYKNTAHPLLENNVWQEDLLFQPWLDWYEKWSLALGLFCQLHGVEQVVYIWESRDTDAWRCAAARTVLVLFFRGREGEATSSSLVNWRPGIFWGLKNQTFCGWKQTAAFGQCTIHALTWIQLLNDENTAHETKCWIGWHITKQWRGGTWPL